MVTTGPNAMEIATAPRKERMVNNSASTKYPTSRFGTSA
jgi:hypothetical protein